MLPQVLPAKEVCLFVWPSRKRLMEPEGIYLGIDENTRLPIRVDPFGSRADRSPTYLILGRPGARQEGKGQIGAADNLL